MNLQLNRRRIRRAGSSGDTHSTYLAAVETCDSVDQYVQTHNTGSLMNSLPQCKSVNWPSHHSTTDQDGKLTSMKDGRFSSYVPVNGVLPFNTLLLTY